MYTSSHGMKQTEAQKITIGFINKNKSDTHSHKKGFRDMHIYICKTTRRIVGELLYLYAGAKLLAHCK